MHTLRIHSTENRQVIDITENVQAVLSTEKNGLVHVFVAHTTAALTTADLDPGTDKDFLDFLQAITPQVAWRHPHDPSHTPDHMLSSLIGPEVAIPFRDGQLLLGTWLRIILVEFSGPRERTIHITES